MQDITDPAQKKELKLNSTSNFTIGDKINTNSIVATRKKNTPKRTLRLKTKKIRQLKKKNYRLMCDICRSYYSSHKEFTNTCQRHTV